MSEENVKIVRRGYEVMNKREFSRAEEIVHPDVVFDMSRNMLNPDVYRGLDGFERLVGVIEEVWDDFHIEPQELIDAGDHVLAGVKISGTGRGSGVAAETHIYNVWTLSDGKVMRLVGGFRDRDEALEAAGLSE